MTSQFFDAVLFLLWNLVTGSNSCQYYHFFWSWIQKSEIPTSEFFPISGEWDELGIPNLARMFLLKSFLWMLQNAIVTAFTVFELLRKRQGEIKIHYPPPTHTHTHTHAHVHTHTHTQIHTHIAAGKSYCWKSGINGSKEKRNRNWNKNVNFK